MADSSTTDDNLTDLDELSDFYCPNAAKNWNLDDLVPKQTKKAHKHLNLIDDMQTYDEESGFEYPSSVDGSSIQNEVQQSIREACGVGYSINVVEKYWSKAAGKVEKPRKCRIAAKFENPIIDMSIAAKDNGFKPLENTSILNLKTNSFSIDSVPVKKTEGTLVLPDASKKDLNDNSFQIGSKIEFPPL